MKGFASVKNMLKRDVRKTRTYVYKRTENELYISNGDWLFDVSHISGPNRDILHAELVQAVTDPKEHPEMLERVMAQASDVSMQFTDSGVRLKGQEPTATLVPTSETGDRVIVVREIVLEIIQKLSRGGDYLLQSSSTNVVGPIKVLDSGGFLGVFMPVVGKDDSGNRLCLPKPNRDALERILSVVNGEAS